MPIVTTPGIRDRIAKLLRANPGREFSIADIARTLGCDHSITLRHCEALATSDAEVWLTRPSSRGAGSRIRFEPKP